MLHGHNFGRVSTENYPQSLTQFRGTAKFQAVPTSKYTPPLSKAARPGHTPNSFKPCLNYDPLKKKKRKKCS